MVYRGRNICTCKYYRAGCFQEKEADIKIDRLMNEVQETRKGIADEALNPIYQNRSCVWIWARSTIMMLSSDVLQL